MLYYGFAIADSMFPDCCRLERRSVGEAEVKEMLQRADAVPCLNPSHKATVEALNYKYGITLKIPEKAPLVQLQLGDELLVLAVRGLPRLEGRHEYMPEEIAKATFSFGLWRVSDAATEANK